MKTNNTIVDFLLDEEGNSIINLLFLPFRNALMKGATMDEESVVYIRRLRFGAVLLGIIFFVIAIEPIFDDALTASDSAPGMIIFFLSVFGFLLFSVSLLGFQFRHSVPPNKVSAFDLNVAKSGGLWGALGLGLWSLFQLYFGG